MAILTDSDAVKLQTAITQMVGGDYTVEGARLFASALIDMSLQEALDAVGEWLKKPHEFNKIMPGDLNKIVRDKRSKLVPTEAEISALYEATDMTSEQYFVWRRRLIHGITRRNETRTEALAAATRSALELAQAQPPVRTLTSQPIPGLPHAFREVPHE